MIITNYDYTKLKQSLNHWAVVTNKSLKSMEVGIIHDQDVYELQFPLDFKIEHRVSLSPL